MTISVEFAKYLFIEEELGEESEDYSRIEEFDREVMKVITSMQELFDSFSKARQLTLLFYFNNSVNDTIENLRKELLWIDKAEKEL